MADPAENPTSATFVDYKTFTIGGNYTATCHSGRRVRAKCGTSRMHGTIESSSYAASLTTVVLSEESEDLTSELTGIWIGKISGPGGDSSLPVHPHENENSGGGSIEADLDCGSWT